MKDTRLSIKALIERDNKYLIIQERTKYGDLWDIPGGGVEYPESPLETLHREIFEELHVEVEAIKPLGMWWFTRTAMDTQVYCYTYLCKPKGEFEFDFTQNPADEDIHRFEWVTKKDLLSGKYEGLPETLLNLIKETL